MGVVQLSVDVYRIEASGHVERGRVNVDRDGFCHGAVSVWLWGPEVDDVFAGDADGVCGWIDGHVEGGVCVILVQLTELWTVGEDAVVTACGLDLTDVVDSEACGVMKFSVDGDMGFLFSGVDHVDAAVGEKHCVHDAVVDGKRAYRVLEDVNASEQ